MAGSLRFSAWVPIPIALVVWGTASVWEWGAEPLRATELETDAEPKPSVTPPNIGLVKAEITLEDEVFICRAAVSAMMNRDLSSINGVRRADGNIGTSYRRPSDKSLWQNVCKISGDRVAWASMDEAGIAGRWRDAPDDEMVTFVLGLDGVTVSQKFGDGSSISDSFGRE
jgi:hypothetical protein